MSAVTPVAPYVGLRPYEESERSIFFGRSREAKQIRNTILANDMIVIVAPSGAGKTSLLRTLVLPALRELEALVVYVDDWSDAPATAIRRGVAVGLGAGAPDDLVAAARSVAGTHKQGLVLVLDQFEQVFVRHGGAIEALSKELGALLRAGAGARLVLSMREEYLASLDSLRASFLTVAQATHRLEPLAGDAAREAIAEPVRLPEFHGAVEPALVEALLTELRADAVASGLAVDAVQAAGLSLPFLQIVCQRLWAAVVDRPERALTLDLYQQFGRCDGIVAAFVREATQDLTGEARLDTAHVLNLLAPRAGVKMAYPVDVLASQLDLPRPRIEAVLDRLDRQRVVRRRERGEVVELFHDAFTRVLRPFIDEELGRAAAAARRRQRRRTRLVITALVLLVGAIPGAVFAVLLFRDAAEEREEFERMRAALPHDSSRGNCGDLVKAVEPLLSRVRRPGPLMKWRLRFADAVLVELRTGLERASADMKPCLDQIWRDRAEATSGATVPSPLTLRYAAAAEPEAVQAVWRIAAAALRGRRRLPVPAFVKAVDDPSLPPGTLRIERDDDVVVVSSVAPPKHEIAVFVSPGRAEDDRLDGYIAERIQQLRREGFVADEWSSAAVLGAVWSAPLFSAPILHTLRDQFEVEVFPAAAAAIVAAALDYLIDEPSMMITPGFVSSMLLRIDERDTCRAREAEMRLAAGCARGDENCLQGAHAQLVALARQRVLAVVGEPPERWVAEVTALVHHLSRQAPDGRSLTGGEPLNRCGRPRSDYDESVAPLFDALPRPGRESTDFRGLSADRLLSALHLRPGLAAWLDPEFRDGPLRGLLYAVLLRTEDDPPYERLALLLHSLPFWHEYCRSQRGEDSQTCLVNGLRDSLKNKASRPASRLAGPLRALADDRPGDAQRLFKAALDGGDLAALREEFVLGFADPDVQRTIVHAYLDHACADLTGPAWEPRARDGAQARALLRKVLDTYSKGARPRCDEMLARVASDTAPEALARSLAGELAKKTTAGPAEGARHLDGLYYLYAQLRRSESIDSERKEESRRVLHAWIIDPDVNDSFPYAVELCRAKNSRGCLLLLLELLQDKEHRLDERSIDALAQEFARQRIAGPDQVLDNLLRNLLREDVAEFERTCDIPEKLEEKAPMLYRLTLSRALHLPAAQRAVRLAACQAQIRRRIDPKLAPDLRQRLQILAADASRMLGRYEEAAQDLPAQPGAAPYTLTLRNFLSLRTDVAEAVRLADGPLRLARSGSDALLHVALAHLMQNDGFAGPAHDFIYSDTSEDRDYILLMYWWRLKQRGDVDAAGRLLALRAAEPAPDAREQQRRYAAGDMSPWRDRMIRAVVDDAAITFECDLFNRTLRATGQTEEFFRCEASFFEALRRSASGDEAGYRSGLCEVQAARCFYSYEYVMAERLLRDAGHRCPEQEIARCAPP